MKKIISYIISIVISILITMLIIIQVISNTTLSEKYIFSKLDKINYYEKIDTEIKNNMQNYILQSGFSEEIIEEIYSKAELKDDINNIVTSIYQEEKENINTEIIKTKLEENIQKYLEENEKKVTDSEKKAIENFVNTIVECYEKGVAYDISYIQILENIVKKVNDLKHKIMATIVLITILMIILLISLNVKELLKAVEYLSIMLFIIGFWLIYIYVFIHTQIKIDTITIGNIALSELIRNMIFDINANLRNTGIITIIMGLICNVIGNKEKNR